MKFEVQIIDSEKREIIKRVEASGERSAERIERGIQINLNHEKYHTEIKQVTAKQKKSP